MDGAVCKLVLVVEDDTDVRDGLVAVLERAGYLVAQAGNGRDALMLAKAMRPSVILLDLMMPIMDGWQFRAIQRGDTAIRDVPVIVLSATVLKLEELRPAAALSKPFDLGTLLQAVDRIAA